ncbi:MAG: choice-of-anchor Q domain-containing protein [Verrucomicrobiota bacterium]|jgi:hypothetical protein
MKLQCALSAAAILALQTIHSPAAVLYVDLNSTNPAPPYADWSTAATNIQNAIDAAIPGDQILVTDGVYQTGGRVVYGSLTNRVVINKAVTVQSVNGPASTIIQGYQMPGSIDGDSAVRCVYLTNAAVLAGFTIANGAVLDSGDVIHESAGGGVWCEDSSAVVSNCVLTGNSGYYLGGGAYSGTLNNCVLWSNSSQSGGGAYSSVLNNCVLTNNAAGFGGGSGGGAASCTLNSCILINNNGGGSGGGASYSILNNCVLTGNFVDTGGGGALGCTLNNCTLTANTAWEEGAGADASTLNNCISYYNFGDNYTGSTLNYCCTTPNAGPGNITNEPLFVNSAYGDFHLQPDSPCINAGNNAYVSATNDLDGNPRIVGGFVDMGVYELQSITTRVLYVNVNNTNPVPPYSNWPSAAIAIQDAVDVAIAGDQIFVTNGVYQTGGRVVSGSLTNRVAVDKALTVQSVNGPTVTIIQGYQTPGIVNDDNAIRCVYLAENAVLSGFTLTNGATRDSGDFTTEQCGGGVFGQSTSAIVSNCVMVANVAYNCGGGAIQVTLNNCVLTGNSSPYGGGGGAYESTVNDSLLIGNQSYGNGGGAFYCNLNNCTVVNNSGGGVHVGTFNNCILYYNDYNYLGDKFGGTVFNYCCTTPQDENSSRRAVFGMGNITNSEPAFINWTNCDFRLQSNSLCINSGDNDYVSGISDLDGNPRTVGGTVDIGAYEFQSPSSVLSYAWLQQYGLTNNGSVDYVDSDHDGLNNWQEWKAGTDPTDSLSVLEMLAPASTNNPSGLVVSWQSVNTRTYYLQCSTNLATQPAFSTIQSNIVGQGDTTSYTDTNAVGSGPYFYRVGVQ